MLVLNYMPLCLDSFAPDINMSRISINTMVQYTATQFLPDAGLVIPAPPTLVFPVPSPNESRIGIASLPYNRKLIQSRISIPLRSIPPLAIDVDIHKLRKTSTPQGFRH